MSGKIPCKYGEDCYRTNPDHLNEFSHPLVTVGKKRKRENGDDASPQQLKKAKPKLPRFPNAHTHQIDPHHPWENDFLSAMHSIRSKPNWQEKVKDSEILAKWKKECTYSFMWKRLKAELNYLATFKSPKLELSAVDGVWHADNIISSDLHNKFTKLVADQLETKDKDWHPFSNETVNDLVHPSLYCYVHGKTPVLPTKNYSHLQSKEEWEKFIGTGTVEKTKDFEVTMEIIEKGMKIDNDEIPETEIVVRHEEDIEEEEEDEEEKNEDIPFLKGYSLVDKELLLDPNLLFAPYTPIDEYNSTAAEEKTNELKEVLSNHIAGIFRWIPSDITVSYDGKVKFNSYIPGLHPFNNSELYPVLEEMIAEFIPLWNNVLTDMVYSYSNERYSDNDWEGVYSEQLQETFEDSDKSEVLNKFNPDVRSVIDLCGCNLQVITKIASIELTPDKPTYKGSWHIEGVPTERIISTGIYYFSQENIDDNYLKFREAECDPDGAGRVQCAKGYGWGSKMNHPLGKVETKEGRLLAFPNTYQHCVTDISLKDKSKPGHRKLLVFFLVDPNEEILSSSRIPPPRKDWLTEAIRGTLNSIVPPEITETILDNDLDLPDLETAKKNRDYLMFTRKYYVVHQNDTLFEREYSFCEH